MTDNDIIKVDTKKYAEALNNLIGVDSAYLKGDGDVDAIVEIIILAKKMENTIKRQKAEIEALKLINSTYSAEVSEIRNIAITDFEERLKATYRDCKFVDIKNVNARRFNERIDYCIRVVDQIAKEMKGEQ